MNTQRGYLRWRSSSSFRAALFLAVLVALSLTVPPSASAKSKTVTVSLTAVVEYVDDRDGILCAPVAVGDTITGSYTYSLKARDNNELDVVGDYWYYKRPNGISLTLGGATTGTDPKSPQFLVEIVNDYNGTDNFLLRSYSNLPLSCGTVVNHISWQLDDPTMTALSDTSLLTEPPNLENFQSFFGLDIDCGERSSSCLVRARVIEATLE